jgi:hypothetical protein
MFLQNRSFRLSFTLFHRRAHPQVEHTPAISEQAAELMANNREGLRAYGVQRAAEIKAMRTRPVSKPGPSISYMGDLAARIVADKTTPITQDRSSLRDWLVMPEETPEVGGSLRAPA